MFVLRKWGPFWSALGRLSAFGPISPLAIILVLWQRDWPWPFASCSASVANWRNPHLHANTMKVSALSGISRHCVGSYLMAPAAHLLYRRILTSSSIIVAIIVTINSLSPSIVVITVHCHHCRHCHNCDHCHHCHHKLINIIILDNYHHWSFPASHRYHHQLIPIHSTDVAQCSAQNDGDFYHLYVRIVP